MIRKKVPRKLWDYGLRWVSETMSLTHTTSGTRNIGEGCIPLTQVTGETPDISEYLDFGFYDREFGLKIMPVHLLLNLGGGSESRRGLDGQCVIGFSIRMDRLCLDPQSKMSLPLN